MDRVRINIIKRCGIILILGSFCSCSRKTIFYYNNFYGIKKGQNFTYYIPPSTSYNDNWSPKGLDKLYCQLKNGKELKVIDYSKSVNSKFKIVTDSSTIFFQKDSLKDTLRVLRDSMQYIKFFPAPTSIFRIVNISNGQQFLSRGNQYFVKYIKDSMITFNNYKPQIIHLFYFYPSYHYTDIPPYKIKIKPIYGDPIIVGFLKKNGILVYVRATEMLFSEKRKVVLLKCSDIVQDLHMSGKRVRKLLR